MAVYHHVNVYNARPLKVAKMPAIARAYRFPGCGLEGSQAIEKDG
jgi:hypothetical protein